MINKKMISYFCQLRLSEYNADIRTENLIDFFFFL